MAHPEKFNVVSSTANRRILVALQLDGDQLIVEDATRKRAPLALDASDADGRLRELVLDEQIPATRSAPGEGGVGEFFAELVDVVSELGEDGEVAPKPIAGPRVIAAALSLDGDALFVQVAQRSAMFLRKGDAHARLVELVRDPTIAAAPAAAPFKPRSFIRGIGRAFTELGANDPDPKAGG